MLLRCVTHRPSGSWGCAYSHVPTHTQTSKQTVKVYWCFLEKYHTSASEFSNILMHCTVPSSWEEQNKRKCKKKPLCIMRTSVCACVHAYIWAHILHYRCVPWVGRKHKARRNKRRAWKEGTTKAESQRSIALFSCRHTAIAAQGATQITAVRQQSGIFTLAFYHAVRRRHSPFSWLTAGLWSICGL